MKTTLPLRLACLAALATAGRAGATDFTDYQWAVGGGAVVRPDALILETCLPETGAWEWANAWLTAPVPGTFTVDLHYEVIGWPEPTGLAISAGSTQVLSMGEWCSPSPCSGDVTGIVLPVSAGSTIAFLQSLGWFFCTSNGGIRCTFTNLQFWPEPGIHPYSGGVSTAHLFDYQDTENLDNHIFGLTQLGDVNGDGHADWACGESGAGQPDFFGIVRVLSGLDGSVLRELKDPAYFGFGWRLANLGDLDGDGVDDLAITESTWPGPSWKDAIGRVHVYSGATGSQLFAVTGKQVRGEFGESIDGVGDVDGDGVGDLLVGAYKEDSLLLGEEAGAVRVFSGATQAELFVAYGALQHEWLGRRASGLGDVNGDGTPDFAAIAPGYATEDPVSIVRVWSGDGTLIKEFTGTKHEPYYTVGDAGDVSADGVCDILLGSPYTGPPASHHFGKVAVRKGGSWGELFKVSGTTKDEELGGSVAAAGDLDGDGFADVLATAWGNGAGLGRAQALAGPFGAPLFQFESDEDMNFHSLVDGGRDMDGDGTPDVVMTANTKAYSLSGVPAEHIEPLLVAAGTLVGGSPLVLSLSHGPPGGTATLVAGLTLQPQPFKGGTLVPSVDRLFPGLPLLPDGSLTLEVAWPPVLVAPTLMFVQAWMPTQAAAQGFVASDALLLSPP